MENIFLISGKAQHGKDSVADILMKKLDGKSIKISLADNLKYILKRYYGWNGEKDEDGRRLLQEIGTDKIREEFGWQVFHAERLCQEIKIIEDKYDYIFIPDVRFKNEIHYIQAMFPYNTTTIRVIRPNFESPLNKEQQLHKSETDLDDYKFEYYIHNDLTLAELPQRIDDEVGELISRFNQEMFFRRYAG